MIRLPTIQLKVFDETYPNYICRRNMVLCWRWWLVTVCRPSTNNWVCCFTRDVPIWTCLAVSFSLGIQCGMRGILSIRDGAIALYNWSSGRSVESTDYLTSLRSAVRRGPCYHTVLPGSEVLFPICFCYVSAYQENHFTWYLDLPPPYLAVLLKK